MNDSSASFVDAESTNMMNGSRWSHPSARISVQSQQKSRFAVFSKEIFEIRARGYQENININIIEQYALDIGEEVKMSAESIEGPR